MTRVEAPDAIAYGIPHLTVENTSFCNIRCRFCKTQNDPHFKRGKMSEAVFARVLEAVPQVRTVHFTGAGEPLSDKRFVDMVGRIKGLGARTRVSTNGSLLVPDTVDRLLALGHDEFFVSFEAWDRDIYNHIMVGSDFDRTVANLRHLGAAMARASAGAEVTLGMMGTRLNVHTLPGVLRFAGEMGFRGVNLQAMMGDAEFNTGNSLLLTPERIVEAWREALPLAEEYGLALQCYYPYKHVLDDHAQTGRVGEPEHYMSLVRRQCDPLPEGRSRLCSFPWFYFTVDNAGRVFPCCHAAGFVHTMCAPGTALGNVLETGLLDIWNGARMRSLRGSLLSGRPEAPCGTCHLYRACDPAEIAALAERVARTNGELMRRRTAAMEEA